MVASSLSSQQLEDAEENDEFAAVLTALLHFQFGIFTIYSTTVSTLA